MSPHDDEPGLTSKAQTGSHDDIVIEEEQLGVYRLFIATSKGFNLSRKFDVFWTEIPVLYRLVVDIYSIDATLLVLFVVLELCATVKGAFLMHLSGDLFRTIEVGVSNGVGEPFIREVVKALAIRALCNIVVSYFEWWIGELRDALKFKVVNHYDVYLMRANLNLDIPTSLQPTSKSDVSGDTVWTAFNEIFGYSLSLVTVISQLVVILSTARASGFPLFLFVCLARPLSTHLFGRYLWHKTYFIYVDNKDYIRMKALKAFAKGDLRQDIISASLKNWIVKEYERSRDRVGRLSYEDPIRQYAEFATPNADIFSSLLNDLPVAYCALTAVFNPGFSLASMAIFQSSSATLQWTIPQMLYRSKKLQGHITSIKDMYRAAEVRNVLIDGKLHYPRSEKVCQAGMSFELRNVSFSYPGSKKAKEALSNVSLTIPAGTLVVVVGSNGSGKSTLLRILTRTFDPTSGNVFVDGHPARDYKIDELCKSSAFLSQEHALYPLSLGENIGLGCVERVHDMDLIKEAARKGGAAEFISQLEAGYDTVLDPKVYERSSNLFGNSEHLFHNKVKNLGKKIDISGGERQRIVASRCFMRLNSPRIKFIAVDEPSSALDAEGEFRLFSQFLEDRRGKTMIFVTHRFGHLTKQAGMVVCMKDGSIAEVGTHEQLMAKGGEYANLFNIQAAPFHKHHIEDDERSDASRST